MISFFAEDKYESIIDLLLALGYQRVHQPNDAQLVWANLKNMDHDGCSSPRWINHFKGSQHFSNKAYLVYHLTTAKRLSPSYIPMTWSPAIHTASDLLYMLLSAEEAELSASACAKIRALITVNSPLARLGPSKFADNIWIVKPTGLSCGEKISICQGMQAVLSTAQSLKNKCVIQKYLSDPLLLRHGRKFDIRQWVLISSLDPLIVYGFSECYLRLASRSLSLQRDTLSDPLMHLCNHAIQKNASDIGEAGIAVETMLHQREFEEELRVLYPDKHEVFAETLLPQIREIVVQAVLSIRDVLSDPHRNSFEWLGFDLMVTRDLSVQLIEINTSPDLSFSTHVTTPLVQAAVTDAIQLLVEDLREWREAPVEVQRERARGKLLPRFEGSAAGRWSGWYAEDAEWTPALAWSTSKAKRGVATMRKDCSLQSPQLLAEALDILCGTTPAAAEELDEF